MWKNPKYVPINDVFVDEMAYKHGKIRFLVYFYHFVPFLKRDEVVFMINFNLGTKCPKRDEVSKK